MNLIQLAVFAACMIFAINVTDASGYSFVGVTKEGVEFPILQDILQKGDVTNATSTLNGFGYTANIITAKEKGRVVWGDGFIGANAPLVPYTLVDANSDFAAVIRDDDMKNTYNIPKIHADYSYQNNALVEVTAVKDNILRSDGVKKLKGNGNVFSWKTLTVFGYNPMIIKLPNYLDINTVITGQLTNVKIKHLAPAGVDLINEAYHDVYGYKISTGDRNNWYPVLAGKDTTVRGFLSWDNLWTYYSEACVCNGEYFRGRCTAYHTEYTYTQNTRAHSKELSLIKEDRANHIAITGTSTSHPSPNPSDGGSNKWAFCQAYLGKGITNSRVANAIYTIYDTLPGYTLFEETGNFERSFAFPNSHTYFYFEPVTDGVLAKAFLRAYKHDPGTDPLLKISNLPANMPYQIVKNGWVGVTGVTPPNGNLVLYESDVAFDGFETKNALLHLYPDSLVYRGDYDTLVFDLINDEIFKIKDGKNRVYVAAASIKLPISFDVTLERIKIGDVSFDYLLGEKLAGDAVFVPVIPGLKKLHLTLNGENASINIEDIQNTAQTKQLSKETNTKTLYSKSNSISSLDVGVSSTVVAIATHTGVMNARVEVSVSGDAEFTVNSDYSGTYRKPLNSCQAATIAYGSNYCGIRFYGKDGTVSKIIDASRDAYRSTLESHKSTLERSLVAQGPLTVLADVFVNGNYYDSFLIHKNDAPQLTPNSSLGLISIQNVKMEYLQTSGSRTIPVNVESGDYVEFVVNVIVTASGIPAHVDKDGSEQGCSWRDRVCNRAGPDASVAGLARGTVNIHYGSITATME